MYNIKNLYQDLNGLTIFRNILNDNVISKLRQLSYTLASGSEKDIFVLTNLYCDFVSSLYEYTDNLTQYIQSLVMEDENIYVKKYALSSTKSDVIEQCLNNELETLSKLCSLSSKDFEDAFSIGVPVPKWRNSEIQSLPSVSSLPKWKNTEINLKENYLSKLSNITKTGYGIYAKYHAFILNDGVITPVKHPDSQTLAQLSGYETERQKVITNTLALLKGEKASNVLLYGDAGTGKSSTIKAIANEYKSEGLRLVEVKKHQLYHLPDLIEQLSQNPLKFIIFIDDLSFSSNDDNFAALKAILEGGVATPTKNLVIYATSNRRHLVKETMSERSGDDLHLNDTLQELMSLSARFGLTITFQKPNKDEYISIVKHLAKQYNLDMPEEELITRAEAFAIRSNGRSPRTAKQCVELLKSGL